MTTQFTGLYFPETIAQYPDFRQLLLFFDTINQYLPAEDSQTPNDLLAKEGLLIQHAPLPFGDGLTSFNKLINDIQGHGNAFYGSYLSSLSNSAAIDIDEASVWNLIGKLAPDKKNKPEQENTLLQARLLLKLAEIHLHDDEEINNQMEILKDKKEALLTSLKGEFSLAGITDMLSAKETESPSRFRQRCKAWSHLLLAKNKPYPWLVITRSLEVIESFQDSANQETDKEALFEIPLTSITPEELEPTDYLEKRRNFQNSTKTSRENLHKLLSTAASSCQEKSHFVPEDKTLIEWQQAIQKESGGQSASLQFYRFQIPITQLFSQTYKISNTAAQDTTSQPNTIIALLNQGKDI